MKVLLLGLWTALMTPSYPTTDAGEADGNTGLLVTDFRDGQSGLGWYVLNDNVMGGRSEGSFVVENRQLRFTGSTNTYGGGFSSIRTGEVSLDLSEYAGIRLALQGDGRRYTWRLTSGTTLNGRPVGYWAAFDTEDGERQTVDLPFSAFVAKFRGYEIDAPPLDPKRITGMGLMIYDGLDGRFDLVLESVSAYGERGSFSLVQYQWEQRVLVLSAPDINNAELEAQQRAVAETRDAFDDRDMVLVTLLDESGSSADREQLTPAQVARTREQLGIPPGSFALKLIGKDGSIKLSTDRAVPMTKIYGLIDGMPMRQREIRQK